MIPDIEQLELCLENRVEPTKAKTEINRPMVCDNCMSKATTDNRTQQDGCVIPEKSEMGLRPYRKGGRAALVNVPAKLRNQIPQRTINEAKTIGSIANW